MRIIRAIVAGERDPHHLAALLPDPASLGRDVLNQLDVALRGPAGVTEIFM